MPGKVIGTTLNLGYAGKVSRNPDNIINTKFAKSVLNGSGVETQPSIAFGDSVILNTDNTVSPFGASGVDATFAGIAVAEVKQAITYDSNAAGGYLPAQPVDVLSRGTATVVCNVGTPTAGGKVYVRVTSNGGNTIVGGFEATADGAHTIEITNLRWTTNRIDANKVAEVTLLSRKV